MKDRDIFLKNIVSIISINKENEKILRDLSQYIDENKKAEGITIKHLNSVIDELKKDLEIKEMEINDLKDVINSISSRTKEKENTKKVVF